MSTCQEVINTAYRELGIIGDGQRAPSAEQAVDGLEALQSWYIERANGGTFGRLTDLYKSEAYTAKEFERIRKDAAVTITIPTTITDDPNTDERTPHDMALIVVLYQSLAQYSLYEATVGAWSRLDLLTLAGTAPLSTRGLNGLACCLATSIAAQHGYDIHPRTVRKADAFMATLTARYASPRRVTEIEAF